MGTLFLRPRKSFLRRRRKRPDRASFSPAFYVHTRLNKNQDKKLHMYVQSTAGMFRHSESPSPFVRPGFASHFVALLLDTFKLFLQSYFRSLLATQFLFGNHLHRTPVMRIFGIRNSADFGVLPCSTSRGGGTIVGAKHSLFRACPIDQIPPKRIIVVCCSFLKQNVTFESIQGQWHSFLPQFQSCEISELSGVRLCTRRVGVLRCKAQLFSAATVGGKPFPKSSISIRGWFV